MSSLIEIDDLSKSFGDLKAVDGISFRVARGEVLGFLGPNGAGKTTTMRMITGFIKPDQGGIVVCGHDVLDDGIAAKRTVGYLPEGAPLYGDMSAAAFLRFAAAARGIAAVDAERRFDWAVERLGLGPVVHQSIETLSKGYKRRVGLAQALMHDPEVLILDEPTDGLDPNQKHEVRMLIREMARDKAIVISTHILEEVDAVCTRAIIISRGRIVFDGTPDELSRRSRLHNAVTATVKGAAAAEVEGALAGIGGAVSVEAVDGGSVRCTVLAGPNGPPLAAVSERLQAAQWTVERLAVEAGSLEEVFRTVTAGPPGDGAGGERAT